MFQRALQFYSQPVVLSVSGFVATLFPFLSYGIIAGMGWEYHRNPWFNILAYSLVVLSMFAIPTPAINLVLLIRYGLKEPKEVASHFVNFTCFFVNLLGSILLFGVAYLWINFADYFS